MRATCPMAKHLGTPEDLQMQPGESDLAVSYDERSEDGATAN